MDQVKVYPNRQALVEAVAEDIVACAQEAIEARGQFSIVLSGGQTPGPLFDRLASHAFRDQIVWGSVRVFWGDDRAVPPDHEDSNYRMAQERLLDHVPIPPAQIHRIHTELAPEMAADHYERQLRKFFEDAPADEPQPRFDYLLQGMGADGHTASLFPGTDALRMTDASRWVVANEVPALGTWRITLTAPAINAGRNVVFMVEGESKAQPLYDVLKGDYRPKELPSQLIAPVNGRLVWMVDESAAALL